MKRKIIAVTLFAVANSASAYTIDANTWFSFASSPGGTKFLSDQPCPDPAYAAKKWRYAIGYESRRQFPRHPKFEDEPDADWCWRYDESQAKTIEMCSLLGGTRDHPKVTNPCFKVGFEEFQDTKAYFRARQRAR